MRLDRFYPIVADAGWVARLLTLGVKLIQLRIKDATEDDISRQVRWSLQLCAANDCQLVVNDYWQIALDEGCDFVHLGQEDLDCADIAALRRAGVRFGLSTHDHAELERALSYDPDYVALGPVYPTLLKNMPWAPQGLARVSEWKERIRGRPLVAIGGLTCDRVRSVFAAGADSAAVVTDIVTATDPDRQVQDWVAVTRV